MTNIQQSLEMETNQSLLHNKSGNGLINNLKASKNTITNLNLVQDGDSTLPPGRRIHLGHHTANKAATGSQIEAGIRVKHHPGLNIKFFFFVQRCHFACRKFNLLAVDGECRQTTNGAPHFLMHSCCAVSLQSCCQSVQSHIDPTHLHGSRLMSRSTLSAFRPKTFTTHPRRAMSYTLQNLTPRTGTPSSPFPESVYPQSEQQCTVTAEWRPDGNTTSYRL